MIGSTISHYKILEKLGEGGMGVVYKAQDLKLDRLVALKFLPPHASKSSEDKARFVQEAKAASALNHPNILTVYDYDEFDGKSFIATELVEGISLRSIIEASKKANQPLSIALIVEYSVQIAEGLSKAHEKRIIHRDIKCDNIMVTSDGQVKIMDFGVAKTTAATLHTKTGATVGTVPYMSPEQARGEKVDHRTDIWSLGVVLYEMICGRLPFESPYSEAIVYSILNEEPKPFSLVRSDMPAEMEAIVKKCLQKNRDHRYQHAEELLADLRRVKTQAMREVPTEEVPTPKKLRWRNWYLIPAAVLLVSILLLVFFPRFTTKDKAIRSIAVLPLENLSRDPEQEYFADGMTEELITNLAKVSALRVISRTSMMHYKTAKKTIPEIAKELNVDAVVEGSVQRSGDRVRITAQLIHASTDRHLWAESYERNLIDVLNLQSELSLAIAKEIRVKVTPQEETRLASPQPVNKEVYTLLLQGKFFHDKLNKDNVAKAVYLYRQAIALDSSNALAWALLASGYSRQAWQNYIDQNEGYEKARETVRKAITLDDGLAQGHLVLGDIKLYHDFDWKGAETEFEKALVLESANADVLRSLGALHAAIGHWEDAIGFTKQSLDLDPLRPITNMNQGNNLTYSSRYDEAIVYFKRALELNPQFQRAHMYIGRNYVLQGKPALALTEMQQENDEGFRMFGMALVLFALDRKKEADEILNEFVVRYQNKWKYLIAELYAYRGEKGAAFEWLEKAYKDRDSWLVWLKGDPLLRSIEKDPRYTDLLRRMGLEK